MCCSKCTRMHRNKGQGCTATEFGVSALLHTLILKPKQHKNHRTLTDVHIHLKIHVPHPACVHGCSVSPQCQRKVCFKTCSEHGFELRGQYIHLLQRSPVRVKQQIIEKTSAEDTFTFFKKLMYNLSKCN